MAPKLIRSILITTLAVTALAALPPMRASAANAAVDTSFPALGTFAGLLNNGQEAQLRGVYVPNILADIVVQQPADQGGFVSPRDGILTQFAAASTVGSTGLLAHNFLAGSKFTQMKYGQPVYLIYGNGRITRYVVTHTQQYQALQPESPYSNFVDLSNNRPMSSGDVFSAAYGHPGAVIFQTCIANNGVSSWGRLFIMAEPYTSPRNIQ
jgi:hypothetical protein